MPRRIRLRGQHPSSRSGVSEPISPSSITPAACTTAVSGCSAGIRASSPASASRSRRRRRRSVTWRPAASSSAVARAHSPRRAPAADQQQVPDPVLLGQVAGDQAAEHAGAAGDQHGPVGVQGAWEGQHDLAGVPRLTHESERLRRVLDRPRAARQRLQHARAKQLQQLGQHLPDALRARFGQIERPIGHARMRVGDLLGVADIGLAHLDKPPARSQQPQRRVNKLPRQRVQPHINARPTRRSAEMLGELQAARRRDMRVVQAHRLQHRPLPRTRRREHLNPKMPSQLHRSHPYPTRRRVHQQPLPALQAQRDPAARNTPSRTPPAPPPPA